MDMKNEFSTNSSKSVHEGVLVAHCGAIKWPISLYLQLLDVYLVHTDTIESERESEKERKIVSENANNGNLLLLLSHWPLSIDPYL